MSGLHSEIGRLAPGQDDPEVLGAEACRGVHANARRVNDPDVEESEGEADDVAPLKQGEPFAEAVLRIVPEGIVIPLGRFAVVETLRGKFLGHVPVTRVAV